MRHYLRSTLAVLFAVSLAAATDALAQRRTTGGGGSDGRSTPSGGSGRTASGGSSTRGSGGSSARPSTGTRDRGTTTTRTTDSRRADDADDRPTSGKIGAVRRSARSAPRDRVVIVDRGVYLGGCWNCDYWGWYHGRWGWYHGGWWYPARDPYDRRRDDAEDEAGGQGYLPYPYAEYDGTGTTFVERRTTRRSSYGAVSAQYFSDEGSTTRAGRFAVEAAFRTLRVEAEYGRYSEPLATTTDRMSTFRIGVGLQPRLGNTGFVTAGLAARTVALDGGTEAGGIDGQLGLQLLPRRPLGINVTGRLGTMRWEGTRDNFTLREMNTTASLFVGRVEVQGGWHWLKLGEAPAFGGPVLGTRIWF